MKNSINYNSMICFVKEHFPSYVNMDINDFEGVFTFSKNFDDYILVYSSHDGFTVHVFTDGIRYVEYWVKKKGGVYFRV